MTFANLTDVSTRLGRPIVSAGEVAQVNAWLSDIETLILSRIPDLQARVLAVGSTLLAATVAMVEANAVVRKVKNPDGKQNEKVDDYSYGLNTDAARGELFLTDDEWVLLTPASSSQAFTITPFGAPGYSTVPYLGWS